MKKKIIGLLLVASLIIVSTLTSFANTIPRVYLNNNKLLLQNSPFSQEGYNYIPLRALADNIGATLKMGSTDSTITMAYGTNNIEMRINDPEIHINSSITKLEKPPILKAGVAYVPVRFIKDALGADVTYYAPDNQIYISLDLPTEDGQVYDSYGRLERKTNLPSNASKFSYILNSVPNSMYSAINFYRSDNSWELTPADGTTPITQEIYDLYPNEISSDPLVTPANIEIWKKLFEKNLQLRLNVSYRTVTDSWIGNLMQTYPSGWWDGWKHKDGSYSSKYPKELKDYVQYLKDNHLTIEGDYYVEPSTTYIYSWGYCMRCWVRFRINSDKVSTAKLFDGADDSPLKTNTWYSGYADLECDTTSRDSDGSDMKIDADYLDLGSVTEEN